MSCYKEELNQVPQVKGVSISTPSVNPGEPVQLNVDAFDPDGDPLYVVMATSKGKIVSKPGELPVQFLPPYKEGLNKLEFKISDGKTTTSVMSEIEVFSYLYDGFDRQDDYWVKSKCEATYSQGEVLVTSTDTVSDAMYRFDLHDKVEPPYAIHMDVALAGDVGSLSGKDKYGIYLNFYNVRSDTLVKALWYRIYPLNSKKNWRLSAYTDKGSRNSWVSLEPNAIGVSPDVKTQVDQFNRLKIVVDADHTITLYANEQVVYTNKDWAIQYVSGGLPPKLILERIGARTTGGKIKVDNVFVSKKTSLSTASLF